MAILVYHPLDADPGGLSPFMQRITQVVRASDARIACPYLGLRVLRAVLSETKRWRLLTDAEELIKSPPPSQRAELLKFLVDHERHVRHWPGLHAKVVAGDTSVLVGSANLTEMGLGHRQEAAVMLDEPALVEEVHAWFDGLWERCETVPATRLEAFTAALPVALPEAAGLRLESPAPAVSAIVVPTPESKHEEQASEEGRFRGRIARAVSREWADAYLDLCADLLQTLEIEEDDARLVMSVPQGNVLPVTINQRYVLTAFHRGRSVIGMMLPPGVDVPPSLLPRMAKVRDHLGSFDAWQGEEPEEVPSFGYFDVSHPRELLPLRDDWLFAVLRETERPWRQSSYRRYHVPTFHRAAVDIVYRRPLLDQAFGPR